MFFFGFWSKTFFLNKHDLFLNGLAHCGNVWVSAKNKLRWEDFEDSPWTPKVRVGNSTAEIYGFRSVVQSWGSHCEWLLGTKQIYKRELKRCRKIKKRLSDGLGRSGGFSPDPGWLLSSHELLRPEICGVGVFERVWFDFNCRWEKVHFIQSFYRMSRWASRWSLDIHR